MSLEKFNALCEFLLDKIEITLFFYKQGWKNWREKEGNARKLKERVYQKPHERNIRFLNISGYKQNYIY